jgi:hypothetical protein
MKSSQLRLFADDSIIYKTIKSQKDCDSLQEDLDAAARWESDWMMAMSFVLSRRCCNEGQVRVCSMSVTLLVLWYLLQAYLAARRWTISILLQCSAV